MEPTQSSDTAQKTITLSVPVAILIAGVFIGACILASNFIGASSGQLGQGAAVAAPKVNVQDVEMAGVPYIGKADAPALAYFSDFQCPYCKQFDQKILSEIKKKYVDTGKLKVVFKDFVFLGPDSNTAALFAKAVWNTYPDQYYAWREAMFAAQDAENAGFGDRASIEKLTATISGIDQKKVSAAVDANKDSYEKQIAAEADETQKFGVTGTPSIIVGKQLVGGFDSLDKYEKAIDAAL
jgi:protein-disulfide isomerase